MGGDGSTRGRRDLDSNGVLTPGITHALGAAGVTLTTAGAYEANFSVSGTEPSQIALFVTELLMPPFGRHLWALVLTLIVGSSLVLAACGSSESIATLDTEKIERAIAQSSLAQRGQRAQVSCPSAVPQVKGLKFSCRAVVGSVSTRFVVVEQDGSGHVHYEAP